ncbi:Protein split ends [Eumeta japonica]|uniref:Protein split ends n=1 Tax=Eumeta variegata TaxID=151549 RepID=A0A4C1WVR3_EUMVA|nr:Protein split ends [Eumeta japonica]
MTIQIINPEKSPTLDGTNVVHIANSVCSVVHIGTGRQKESRQYQCVIKIFLSSELKEANGLFLLCSRGEPDGTTSCTAALVAAAPANWRGTNDSASEYCRRGNTPSAYGRYTRTAPTAPYATPPSGVDRTPHHRWYGGSGGGESTPSTPGGGGTPAGDGGGRRRRRSGSGGASHSSRSSSTSREPSSDSRASTPTAAAAAVGASAGTSPATPLATTPSSQHNHRPSQTQWSSTASGRPLAICVRNLPTRSSDSSLKDGLYHEYKKHGKVVWVKVVGQNADRYAIVRFKKPSDVEKALEVSQDKLFFGCKISVAPHQSCDEDAESAKPYETDIDEFHPKATRTLFIGNLEKDVTQQQLREKFKHFGRIIEIDIKKGSGGGSGYAFCQYASIASVVEAIRAMDGEYVGGSRVKLGFGKPVATACVWIDGLTEHTEKQVHYLRTYRYGMRVADDRYARVQVVSAVSRCGTATSVCVDRAAGAALVHFEQASAASAAVRELRRLAAQVSSDPDQRRLMVDYASRECQEAFYEQLEKHGGTAALAGSERLSGDLSTRYIPSTRHDTLRYDGCGARSRAPSYGRGSSRTPRYTGLEHYDPADYAADRRYRVFDDLGSSPQIEDGSYEERLQSVVVSPHRARRHRRDSSSDEHKHSKERHRSGGTRRSSGELRHRSRSGSRSEHRRRGSDSERRRHRRRRDESGSRAGTPLCDELPEGPAPAEPRRPPQPRDRSHLPMSLPLPKFAAQVLRSVASHAPPPAPTTAPASPPRPPSASSSSGSSAPHSPSLEERIRSLDEKYEKWSGSRIAAAEAAQRGHFRHRLLEIDINEVKPSEVVRSLLAKRSVFDEDSERLEGTALQRPPSPAGSPQPKTGPRALQYPFPTHTSSALTDGVTDSEERLPPNGFTTKILRDRLFETMKSECKKNLDNLDTSVANLEHRINSRTMTTLDPILDDPRLNRHDRLFHNERISKLLDSDNKQEKTDIDLRRLSIEKLHFDSLEKYFIKSDSDHIEIGRDPRIEAEKRRREIHNKDIDHKILDIEPKLEKYKSSRLFPDLYRNDKHIIDTVDNVTLSRNETLENSLALLHSERKSFSKENLHCDSPKLVEYNQSDAVEYGKVIVKEEKSVKCEVGLEMLDKKLTKETINVATKNERSLFPDDANRNKLFTQSIITLDRSASNVSLNKEACVNVKEQLDLKSTSGHQHDIFDFKLQNNQETENVKKRHSSTDKEEKQSCIALESDKSHKVTTLIHEDNTEKDTILTVSAIIHKLECNRNQTTRTSSEDKPNMVKDTDLRKNQKEKQDLEKESKDVKSFKTDKPGEQIEKEKRSKDDVEKDKSHILKTDKDKYDKEKENKLDRESEKYREKCDKEIDKVKNTEDKAVKHENRKDKSDKDRKKDHSEINDHVSKPKKEDHKHKHERHKKDHSDSKRETKKDSEPKPRKSSRDESTRELCRKDSTDSSASRTSHDSLRTKDSDTSETKDEAKLKTKVVQDNTQKHKTEKVSKSSDVLRFDDNGKTKLDVKDDRENYSSKNKGETLEKQRHYSVDSPSLDSKRKERLNSCSSLPSNIGYKRRMSSQDSIDSLIEESKKSKVSERRDSKDSSNDSKLASLQDDIDFLATLELRSSEEDEKQKALRKEMKEKKRIQQLQQIQELQMQQDALQQTDNINKIKDDKKTKIEEKKKETAREKRMSTERKSRDEKIDSKKNKCRKQLHSSDTSDSDEPKKHSIFDIVDDEPTYISMYDKVKARSCKNMQKQEEEKRQEKIKAKFSQLKQSRAKREEKKRSSWDEDSDSDHDKKKPSKVSVASSSEDERAIHNKKRDKGIIPGIEYDNIKNHDRQNYFSVPSTEEDSKNKLCRKSFRTRIMSDTSDDELLKTCINKNITFQNDMRKDLTMDSDVSTQRLSQECDLYSKIKDDICNNVTPAKPHDSHKSRKNTILSLFQNTTDYDVKLKDCSLDIEDDNKINNTKIVCTNELSSESESMTSSKFCIDILKKLKKKQKKSKQSISEDEIKESIDYNTINDNDVKHKHTDKVRKHGNKKEKRRDKNRESTDIEDIKDDKMKIKKIKNSLPSEGRQEYSTSNLKREGKMEDIFGPLSDESDSGIKAILETEKNEVPCNFTCNVQMSTNNCEELRDKDDLKRKKEKKKREKRYVNKDDDNSLDVDAAGRAIEAQLFAESAQDCVDQLEDCETDHDENIYKYLENTRAVEKHLEKQKKECKERKKKKKKSKEDRQSRKDHHQYQHNEKLLIEKKIESSASEILLIDVSQTEEVVILEDSKSSNCSVKIDTNHTFVESPSLPRLTDSPPIIRKPLENIEKNDTNVLEIKPDQEQVANEQKMLTSSNDDAKVISTGFSSDYSHLNTDKNKTSTLLPFLLRMI